MTRDVSEENKRKTKEIKTTKQGRINRRKNSVRKKGKIRFLLPPSEGSVFQSPVSTPLTVEWIVVIV
jgi:hypothetical protein